MKRRPAITTMADQWWSWVLPIVGVTGLYFAGKRKPWAWLIGLFAECLWLAYAIVTKQYGFVLGSFAYGAVYVKNSLLWLRGPNIKAEIAN